MRKRQEAEVVEMPVRKSSFFRFSSILNPEKTKKSKKPNSIFKEHTH